MSPAAWWCSPSTETATLAADVSDPVADLMAVPTSGQQGAGPGASTRADLVSSRVVTASS
jgi:hypothetical protein